MRHSGKKQQNSGKKISNFFNENFEIRDGCKGVHCVDLGESFPTHIYLQNLASIQPRTSPFKFARSPRTDPPGEADTKPGHCMILIYTSGTTGNPKAVMISNDTLFFELASVLDANPHLHNDGSSQMRVLSYLPLSHVAGMMVDIWMPVFSGIHIGSYGTCCFARPNDLKDGTIAHRLQLRFF